MKSKAAGMPSTSTQRNGATATAIDSGSPGRDQDDIVISILQDFAANNISSSSEDDPIVSIPKIPKSLYQDDDYDAHKPRVISIGPYHRGQRRLQQMENLKRRYLQYFIDRGEVELRFILEAIQPMETATRRCYDHFDLDNKPFLEMMLLDGCFIVEYFLRGCKLELPDAKIWMEPLVRNDLLLLENQLPFFLIERIFFSINPNASEGDLIRLAKNFCNLVDTISTRPTGGLALAQAQAPHDQYHWHHLVHVYHVLVRSSTVDNCTSRMRNVSSRELKWSIPCATFLQGVGIEFKKKEGTSKVTDVTFKNGLMEITPLFIDTFTIFQLRNFIAYEKLDPYAEPRFTAFAKFMDCLIDTSKDVALLRKNGIIEHAFGSDEEVATIFNKLNSRTLDTLPSEMTNIYYEVDRYWETKRHRWRAFLMRDHFRNPWKLTYLVGELILLFPSLLQTFFSMFSYFRPP